MSEHLVVPLERAGLELDEYLGLLYPGANKGFLRRMVHEGRVQLDGRPTHPSQRLRPDQVVSVDFDDDDLPLVPVAPETPVPILYEDEAVLVVDKPADLAVEPERWRRDAACLSGALLAEAVERGAPDGGDDDLEQGVPASGVVEWRPRLVHRIDKDTTGCVVVAKHLEAERVLREAFQDGRVEKHYLALVEGELPAGDEPLVVDAPIGADKRRSGRMRVARDGRPARTLARVARAYHGYTLVDCQPVTGRTHQIRVHMSHAGFPLAVDPLYGRRDALLLSEIKRDYRPKRGRAESPLIGRLTLHAASITFPDVARGEGSIRVESPLPKDFERALKQLAKVRPAR